MVKFIATRRGYGTQFITGPISQITYHITEGGVPVLDCDADAILAILVDPCCGQLPFDGKVRLFYEVRPTVEQLVAVPEWLLEFKFEDSMEVKNGDILQRE